MSMRKLIIRPFRGVSGYTSRLPPGLSADPVIPDRNILAIPLGQIRASRVRDAWSGDGLVKAGGKQRTNSTHMVAPVAALNRLELAGESVRAALEALAAAHPDWTAQALCVGGWARRSGTPVTAGIPRRRRGNRTSSPSPTRKTGTRCWKPSN